MTKIVFSCNGAINDEKAHFSNRIFIFISASSARSSEYTVGFDHNLTLRGLSRKQTEFVLNKAMWDWMQVINVRFKGSTRPYLRINSKKLDKTRIGEYNPVEQSISFSSSYIWDEVSLYKTALHEFGHFLGLEHSKDTVDIMYPNIGIAAKLSSNDIKRAVAIYGSKAS